MFKSISNFVQEKIRKNNNEEIDEQQLMHLASAALLLEVSRADFDIQDEELESIVKSLTKRFNFSVQEADSLIELARVEQDSHVSIHPFVKIINEGCSADEKKLLLEDLWRVAYADNKLDKYEEYQLRKIADLLYIPHSAFIQTKLSVTEG
ncbi:MAG: TerB family tellurite resistance protein [Gammaproteobacteria bacterium]